MGFSTLIDILGSIMIGGFLLLLLLMMNGTARESSFNFSEEVILQQNLTSVAQIVEEDFRKIGYCKDPLKIPEPNKSIIIADTNRIKFLTDVDNDKKIDSLEYVLGPYDQRTSNPDDKILYRIVNRSDTTKLNVGITEFRMVYMNAGNDTISFPIAEPEEIASMEINLAVEKTDSYGSEFKQTQHEEFSGAFWRQIRLVARNLENR